MTTETLDKFVAATIEELGEAKFHEISGFYQRPVRYNLTKKLAMTPEQRKLLEEIRDDLRHLSEVACAAQNPVRTVLTAQIFILVQKVRYLLGEEDK